MNYVLMHKRKPVAEIKLDKQTSSISKIGEVFAKEHVPLGIEVKKGQINRGGLNEWWKSRSIPATRVGIEQLLETLNIRSTENLLDKSYGLSLSDQYWICPTNSNLKWDDINFFHHTFSEDVGNILFDMEYKKENINLLSPDNTSDGWLKKKWKIIDGKRVLIKGGSGATQQEPYNEVFASKICERLGIPHIPYSLMIQENYPYSMCENFIDSDTELISAWYVMQTEKKQNHVSVHQHYLNCCECLEIPDVEEFIDKMIVLDYLIANEDRHQYNFGVIRNAETLAFIGASPIFDSGTSLWHDRPLSLINANQKKTCKPFKNNHEDQLKLVQSFDWFEPVALYDIESEFHDITKDSLFIDDKRKDRISFAFRDRMDMLLEYVNVHSKERYFSGLDVSNDVKKDVKYTGEVKPIKNNKKNKFRDVER
ncbi:HipA domain-containing protein [Pseudogracilibacillus sp. SO30301A]|uniref:HipA domain-containing protein n=1 Tax=Pseudogracilibacillus sp. SO30301A TaxID=3098291 RepID=UPI00300E678D